MTDFILIVVLAAVVGAAARYVYKARKSGVKCIGCPAGASGCCCSSNGAQMDADCSCGSCKGCR